MKTIEQKLDAENIELDFELEDLDDIAKIISVRVILTPSEPPASDSDTLVFVGNPVLSFESIEIAKKDRQGGSFEPFANIQEIGEFQQNGVRGLKELYPILTFPFKGMQLFIGLSSTFLLTKAVFLMMHRPVILTINRPRDF